MPIRTFADETTADIFAGRNTKPARRIPQDVWRVAQRKMSTVGAAKTMQDLKNLGLQVEALPYDKPGYLSVRVNDKYRITFRFQNGDAYDAQITNHYGKE